MGILNSFFNYGQDKQIKWIENLDYHLSKKYGKRYFRIRGFNRLTFERGERVCRSMFNHVGFYWGDMKLSRLIGFGDDGRDFYYITKRIDGKVAWYSMVGGFTSLKGKIGAQDYANLEHAISPADSFILAQPKKD